MTVADRKAYEKAWKQANKDKVAAHMKAWKERRKAAGLPKPGLDYIKTDKRAFKARTKRFMPAWADRKQIRRIYKLAADFGLHVDHVIPLNGANVSGLHVHHNLQLLTPDENIAKGSKFDPWTHVHELPTPQPA